MTRSKRQKLNESTHMETSNGPEDSSVTTTSSNLLVASVELIPSSADSLNVEIVKESRTTTKQNITGTLHPSVTGELSPVNMTISTLPFKVGEVTWGKIRGWPHWPAKIVHIFPRQFEVVWYNDYRVTKLYRSQVFKFTSNFSIFAEKIRNDGGIERGCRTSYV